MHSSHALHFQGAIPPEVGMLKQLEEFYLSFNR
jgi:hypothetical protein